MPDTDLDWLERIPKVELHLHLEGAIPHPALWELIRKYGGDPSVPTPEALEGKFAYRDFPHFIETWVWKNNFLREYDDFTLIAESVARDLGRQNVIYAEVFFSPGDFARHGLKTQRITEAIRKGLSRVSEVEVALVPDLIRDFGPEKAVRTLAEVNEVKELGVVGVGIGGSEQEFPPEPFQHVYEKAREFGFYTSAHAGEAAGAESIWGAIRALRVNRIGHGTRAREDGDLLTYLAEHKIPLEMSVTSNVRTGAVASLESHPIGDYFDRGILVTVNTDDPKMFGSSLAEEYRLLVQRLGFSMDEIRCLMLRSVEVSWLAEDKKTRLTEQILRFPE
ncbi:MAG: adenosine deaminase [Candidatus Eisenbacteria bacterium]